MIPVASPVLSGMEKAYVAECIDSTWISSAGKFIGKFEAAFAALCGSEYAVACNNGTTALHLALAAVGIGPGDEVIVPTLTYIATANAVRYCGATPVFADSEPDTLNVDPTDVKRKITERTKAIIPVHLYGHPADMTALMNIADEHGLTVIEDAAEAHGAEVDGRRVGSIGHMGVFSFFGNKIVTTGEGGAVTTDDPDLAARLRLLRGQGMDPKRRYWFPEVGYNYRMTNIAAAIGLAQLEQFDAFVARRDEIGALYDEHLADVEGLALPIQRPDARRVHWLYTISVEDFTDAQRDQLIEALHTDGVETRPVFYPLHVMPPYLEETRYPVAEHRGATGISLPTHVGLSDHDIHEVCEKLMRHLAIVRAVQA
ncbi:DegT/DnrJ/EryC1/StrS family aminotransferase [Xylanimonas allomyrinae]|uniref:DegT/DnrJ/EryC1/StrS family aminotransferase n=2 Tax=Xylanimonas allomyrinae TaxID=2509459 RepID=A0A4P6EL73_9MICO|nr:DegT/DnrJ/EryC1/StrS family aminotransferase [Xylanimonas allomyrinae]